jgi:hypothetical protein
MDSQFRPGLSSKALAQTGRTIAEIIDRCIGEIDCRQRATYSLLKTTDAKDFYPNPSRYQDLRRSAHAFSHTSFLTMYHSPSVRVPTPQSTQLVPQDGTGASPLNIPVALPRRPISAVCVVPKGKRAFTKYVRPNLWKEHQDADNLDYMFGIGVPESDSGGDLRLGMAARFDLIFRACEVQREPSGFSENTVKFANRFMEQWYCRQELLQDESALVTD